MQKLLIISYYFPPGNFAGSYRIQAWAEHLHKFGYYPIVVTRHWNENETDYTAISKNKEIAKEENEKFTVYRLPFKGSFRDRLIKRFGNKAQFFGKILSFFQVIGQNYFLSSVPCRNLYDFSRQLLKDNPDINIVITSGRPFVQFRFCYLLKKEFPQIQWIADYRDPWNSWTHIDRSLKLRFFRFFEKNLERKWINNSMFFVTCSEGFLKNIKTVTKHLGFVITNGFENFVSNSCSKTNDQLTISFIGSLYNNQRIEAFIEGYIRFIDSQNEPQIILMFFGLNNQKEQFNRINKVLNKYDRFYLVFKWLSKEEMLQIACKSDCFILNGIPEQNGRHTAKLFDYFSMRKPIILCPSDNDILEETIKETETGVVLNTPEEVEVWLNNAYAYWQLHKSIPYNAKEELLLQFTYEKQVEKLASLIKEKIKEL
jgi:hypothetical protein